jgi:hypothetical protein
MLKSKQVISDTISSAHGSRGPDTESDRAQREEQRLNRARANESAAEPILAELANAGVRLRSIASSPASELEYAAALPIYFRHLEGNHPEAVLATIATVVAAKQSLPYREKLIELFKRPPLEYSLYKYALASAIARTSNPKNLFETIELARDPSFGINRLALLSAIKRSRKPEIQKVIAELRNDPDLTREIDSWKPPKVTT